MKANGDFKFKFVLKNLKKKVQWSEDSVERSEKHIYRL
jgi:hypothetical protein